MRRNGGNIQQTVNKKESLNLFLKCKEYLFKNCFNLVSNLNISMPTTILLLTIEELQKFGIISRLASNPTIDQSPEMAYVDQISRYLVLDLTVAGSSSRDIMITLFMVCQILLTLLLLLPIRKESWLGVISKFGVVIFQTIFTIPCLLIGADSLSLGFNPARSFILVTFSLINQVIYKAFQFECSFEREFQNVLVRVPRSLTSQLIDLLMVVMFPILKNTIYPTSFLIYLVVNGGVIASQWSDYLRTFIYFEETFANLKGILLSINISAHLCYLSIDTLNNTIIAQNVLLFITAFSIFLANFFVVFRNTIVKNIIINQEMKGQHQISIFCVFYWHCYRKVAQKKNQLYLSSLLKKHTNQCQDLQCCCKHREVLYDSNLRTFGNPKLQPHFDRIFIRHFIRKLLMKGCAEHTKSLLLIFLLGIFDVQALQMVTQTIELIKRLNRLDQKKKLNISEQYLLYCLKQKTKQRIQIINTKRGNCDLESVKKFDEKMIQLQGQLSQSIKLYSSLWKHLGQTKFDESGLFGVCKKALQMMFSMEEVYDRLKSINRETTELRAIMLFYARMVLHDIHLLSEIKKDIKISHERNVLVGSLDLINIKLFSSNTASMISLQNGKIKWTSKNAHSIFEYSQNQFHGLTIKNLMPRYFADHHDEYIQKWKQTGHHIKLNKTTYSWGSNKDGTVFSLLLFVKVIPLSTEQDYAFFASIQKIDSENEVVCSHWGEIYGTGKLFAKTVGLNGRLLQEMQPNIQMFMPFVFQFFLQYFYPKNMKLKNSKRSYEIRRDGYFPENLQGMMRQIGLNRSTFMRNHHNSSTFTQDYLNFVRQKMQELTCSVSGQYISFLVSFFRVVSLQREKKDIVCLKFTTPKKDNVERYYSDLQKMINRLQQLSEEENTKGRISNKKTRTDFFRAFLNPRKVKKMLQKQINQAQNVQGLILNVKKQGKYGQKYEETIRSDPGINNRDRKSSKHIVQHRKLLALGAQTEIKNERVRYNLWKIKKMLYQEGVISRYTFNLLIGKKHEGVFDSIVEVTQRERTVTKTVPEIDDDRNASEIDVKSQDDGSEDEMADKENDNQTFNSASSSATFISMTNQVKHFKSQLRSLNTPHPLFVLNILVIMVVLAMVGGLMQDALSNRDHIDMGLVQFGNNKDASSMMSALIEGQMNINNVQNSSNAYFLMKQRYFANRTTTIFREQMEQRNVQKEIDPSILSYLQIIVIDKDVLRVKQFMEYIIDQIVTNFFDHVIIYSSECIKAIIQHSNVNIFFHQIFDHLTIIFAVFTTTIIILLLISLPIVRKIQQKIKDIYSLMGKISPKEKQKYLKHYTMLEQQFKKREQIDHQYLTNLLLSYEAKNKNSRFVSHAFSEEERRSEAGSKAESKDPKQSISTDRVIYFKVIGIYFLFIGSIGFYYFYNSYLNKIFDTTNDVFTQVLNQKSTFSLHFIDCNFELMGYKNDTDCLMPKIGLVDAIYNTYQLPSVSSVYQEFVDNFVRGDVCENLRSITKYITFSEDQIQLCKTVNNGSYSKGAINSMYYIQRKIEYQIKLHYIARNNTPNDQSALFYPDYFQTQEYFQINLGYFYNTVLVFQLFDQIFIQMGKQTATYKQLLSFAAYITFTLIIVFTIAWIYTYIYLGENASYINAFLLLVPFDVLSQNPYIKLYIRTEFDFKATNY